MCLGDSEGPKRGLCARLEPDIIVEKSYVGFLTFFVCINGYLVGLLFEVCEIGI